MKETKLKEIGIYKEILNGKRKHFPTGFWTCFDTPNLESAGNVTRYLLEEKLHWSDEEIRNNISQKTFLDNGLFGMLCIVFNGDLFKALDNAYPGKFKEWELVSTPNSFWNLETAKLATVCIIEEA